LIRITGGQWRNRPIPSPPREKAIRPTTARLRESIFSRLQARLDGARFLDLFAGSGVMSLEALSRGAAFALAIERERRQAAAIREAFASLSPDENHILTVLATDTLSLTVRPPQDGQPFNIAFADPPYGFSEFPRLLAQLGQNGWLTEDAVLIVEQGRRDPLLPGFEAHDYGDTVLLIQTLSI